MCTRWLRWVPAALLLVAGAAGATSRPELAQQTPRGGSPPWSVRIDRPEVQRALTQGRVWQSFRARHGDWKSVWNELSGTPHRAFGPGIELPGFANDAASVDRAVRAFIGRNPDLFGGRGVELQTVTTNPIGDRWVVNYRQLVQGIPVLDEDWQFRVSTSGKLYLFAADAHHAPADLDVSTRIVPSVARQASTLGVAFDPSTDRVEGGRTLYLLPTRGADGSTQLRPVVTTTVITHKPRDSQLTFVDAQTGSVLYRESLRDDISGTATGTTHWGSPLNTPSTTPFANERVNATSGGTNFTNTNAAGFYSVTAPGSSNTVTSALSGPYCIVDRYNAIDASFSQSGVGVTGVVNIDWTSRSQQSERDVFYHVNLAHDWVKSIDPAYTASDYQLLCNVDISDGDDCAAFWESSTNSLNFYPSGSGCPNTGTMPDVIWHEYAHSVMYNLYFTVGGQPFGLQNQALAEGLADAFSALLEDDPTIGNDFFGPGTMLRSLQTTAKWPDDKNPNAHNTALIVGGALWDLRLATSISLVARLRHFALKIGFPDDGDDGVAFSEFFIDMLDADDNDGNLSNGTPNMNAIVAAFNAHGIGTAYQIAATHEPLDDQLSNGPYPVNVSVQYNAPIGSFVSATLYYSVNSSPYASAPMLPTGNPDEYGSEISQQSYGIVRYYMVFTDSYGGTQTIPGGAPNIDTYTFLAGFSTPIVNQDMESNPSWTVGFTGDAATSGVWVRGTPVPSGVQPGEDHSPSGTQCWVTGNSNLPGDPPGTDDVDGGKTTLVTNTFDAVGGSLIQPVVSYWYWFSNNVGDAPNEDPWRVYISNNNGSTWTLVKSTTASTNSWRRETFFIKKFLTPTNQMKMRFVAQDTSNLSLVEAGIDDFLVVGYTTVGVDPPSSPTLAMARAWPNPFDQQTHVRLSLPSAGRVDLSVFDLAGRKVRTLIDGDRPAGVHDIVWDGLTTSGKPAPSGPYFLRMTRGDRVISRGVVLLR